MQKFYSDNKQTIWAVAGIGAAAAVIAAFVLAHQRKSKSGKSVVTVGEVVAAQQGLTKLEKANIIVGIQPKYVGNFLTVETIQDISDALVKFAAHDFYLATKADREERRKNKDDVEKYIELWDKYTLKLEEIVELNQKAVLRELNLSESVYESSNAHHIAENNQELFMLHATLPQRLKATLAPTKTLTLQEFKEILKSQVEVMNLESLYLKEISAKTKHAEEAAPIINNRVSDVLQHKYLVEEEDLLAAMQSFSNDPMVQQLFVQLQQANMKLFPMPEGLF